MAARKDRPEGRGVDLYFSDFRLFYHQAQPIEREADVHVLYDLVWHGTPSDVNKEVNDGRGPMDFSVSRGASDKTVVEFKLATNTKLKKNLEKQAEIYKKSARAAKTIKAIVYFTRQQEIRLRAVLKELMLDKADNIVSIDARSDNKVSGSRA